MSSIEKLEEIIEKVRSSESGDKARLLILSVLAWAKTGEAGVVSMSFRYVFGLPFKSDMYENFQELKILWNSSIEIRRKALWFFSQILNTEVGLLLKLISKKNPWVSEALNLALRDLVLRDFLTKEDAKKFLEIKEEYYKIRDSMAISRGSPAITITKAPLIKNKLDIVILGKMSKRFAIILNEMTDNSTISLTNENRVQLTIHIIDDLEDLYHNKGVPSTTDAIIGVVRGDDVNDIENTLLMIVVLWTRYIKKIPTLIVVYGRLTRYTERIMNEFIDNAKKDNYDVDYCFMGVELIKRLENFFLKVAS
ncbi:MAG: hypothetical protein Q6351_009065 [Candidatus Njordarchaeum guaymaensis]